MTKQELFDLSCGKIREQGKAAFVKNENAFGGGSCEYRTADGLGCALGVCFTDEEIKAISDAGCNQKPLVRLQHDKLLPERFHEHGVLLASLQDAHDHVLASPELAPGRRGVTAWAAKCRSIAADYNLNAAVLEGL